MLWSKFTMLSLLTVLAFAQDACGASAFSLGFLGCDTLSGPAGSTVRASYACTVTHAGDGPGVQGWSISLSPENATITSVTTVGTTGRSLLDVPGAAFEKIELSNPQRSVGACAGRMGAVGAMVPSFTARIELPLNRASTIALFSIEAVIPAAGGQAVLQYVNHCTGAGQPVPNILTVNGQTVIPAMAPRAIALLPSGASPTVGIFDETSDIGSPPVPGSTTHSGGVYRLRGSGDDIWDGGDSFHFAYQCVSGDFAATARVLSRSTNTAGNRWGRHGLMARWSAEADSKYSMVCTTFPTTAGAPEQDAPFHQYRLYHGAPGNNRVDHWVDDGAFSTEGRQPTWMRLVRLGNTVHSYLAEDADRDGEPDRWCLAGSDTAVDLPPSLLVGLAAHSHQPSSLAEVHFDRVTIEPLERRPAQACTGGAAVFTATYSQPDESLPAGARVAAKSGSQWFRHPAVRDGRLQLTDTSTDESDDGGGDAAAAVWHTIPGSADLAANGFLAEFDVYMTAPFQGAVADGLTFAVIERGQEILGDCPDRVPGVGLTNVTSLPFHAVLGTDCGGGSTTFQQNFGFISRSTTGGDIWNNGDSFDFQFTAVTGDFDIAVQAHYWRNDGAGRWGKYGLMARWSNDATARFTMAQAHGPSHEDPARQAGRNVHLQGDATYDAVYPSMNARPRYLRLTRRGNVVQSWVSNDFGFKPGAQKLNPCNDCNWIAGPADDWGSQAPPTILVGFANSQHVSSGCVPQEIYYEFLSCVASQELPSDLVGVQGGALGYGGGTLAARTECHPSFAVELDNWIGGGENEPVEGGAPRLPEFYHFGLNVNSSVTSVQTNADFGPRSARYELDPVQNKDVYKKNLPDPFSDQGVHVAVQYDPSGQVSVTARSNDGTVGPTKVLSARIRPLAGDFLVGFTAGTGGGTCRQEVDNLRLRRLNCTPTLSFDAPLKGATGGQGVRIRATVKGLVAPLSFAWEVVSGTATIQRFAALQLVTDSNEVLVKASEPGVVRIGVTVIDAEGQTSQAEHTIIFEGAAGGSQMPVDCNQDGAQDISDAICILGHLFNGSPRRLPCGDGTQADPANKALLSANGDLQVDLSDAVYLLGYLFLGGQRPVPGLSCKPIDGCPEACMR